MFIMYAGLMNGSAGGGLNLLLSVSIISPGEIFSFGWWHLLLICFLVEEFLNFLISCRWLL